MGGRVMGVIIPPPKKGKKGQDFKTQCVYTQSVISTQTNVILKLTGVITTLMSVSYTRTVRFPHPDYEFTRIM
jgi:hypothetical protein